MRRQVVQWCANASNSEIFEVLTLEVVSGADLPGPTRLHLKPKAERELAWAAMWCLPTAAISAAVQLWWDERLLRLRGVTERCPGELFILAACRSPTRLRTVEENLYVTRRRGRTAGGSDMKGSSGRTGWVDLPTETTTHGCVSVVVRPLEFSSADLNRKFEPSKTLKRIP